MPDLGALLWPRTVALIGASADAESLRGRIFNVMRGHAFSGQLYPVSRSSAEVLGLRAYSSIGDLPQPADALVVLDDDERRGRVLDLREGEPVRDLVRGPEDGHFDVLGFAGDVRVVRVADEAPDRLRIEDPPAALVGVRDDAFVAVLGDRRVRVDEEVRIAE